MKRKLMITAVLAALLIAIPAIVQSKKEQVNAASGQELAKKKAKSLEVSFDYQKQAGPGSNQYAVWIENEKGEVVKTLFVTSYTTKGRARGGEQARRGYIVRPNCVPIWVKAANANEQTDQQLDAFTGATPQTGGTQTFTWDFTDQQGKAVPQGTYKVLVEATLYQASEILYYGFFSTKDKVRNIAITSQVTMPDETHKDMVTNVKAVLK